MIRMRSWGALIRCTHTPPPAPLTTEDVAEAAAAHLLDRCRTIETMHAPDQLGVCVVCEMPHPCKTYKVASGVHDA